MPTLVTEALPKGEADTDTGEITRIGQLMFGLDVDTVQTQRRAELPGMTEREFNATYWRLEEGDRMTVVFKNGGIVVKLVEGWRVE